MKFKNLLILLAVVAVLLLIVRGDMISIYTSSYSTGISSNWNRENSVGTVDPGNKNTSTLSFSVGKKTPVATFQMGGMPSVPTFPVVVVYKTAKIGDVDAEDPLVIDISDKDLGSYWMPLIKRSKFNFTIDCDDEKEMKTSSSFARSKVRGEIIVSGNFSFLGFCSPKTARKIIAENVSKTIYNEAKKRLNNE